jgi:Arc/MetJ family transcription regulator
MRCIVVYMGRTNIDIDDELVSKVMRRYGLTSKRAAVDLALRRLTREPLSRDEALALEGSGWDADLGDIRRSRIGA